MAKNDLQKPLTEEGGQIRTPLMFFKAEGSIMFSMAWPMMVSFFCRMAMASVDSAFVGHITNGKHSSADYLAAAGLSDMVTGILTIPPLAFNQSLNALVSQAMGSGNKKKAGIWLQSSLFWLTLGYVPCLTAFFYVEQSLELLGFDKDLAMLSGTFAKWNIFWPIPNGWYQCMRFYFQAQGITRPAMYNNIIFLWVNVFLNWTFVFGGPFQSLGWKGYGFIGAAMSLSASRCLQPLAYWLYMFVYRKGHTETWPGWSTDFLKRDTLKTFMDQSLPQVGTLILQAVIGQTTTLLIAQLGKTAIAASAAATGLTQVFTGGLSATLCAVCGIRVGFHLGKGDGIGARQASWMIFSISAASMGLIALFLVPFNYQAVSIMTNDTTVRQQAAGLVAPILLNGLLGLIVNANTGGVFTSQGRTKLATLLSFGVELPLSLGSVAYFVIVLHSSLLSVYWIQAAVSGLEVVLVLLIFLNSDWSKYAMEAQRNQKEAPWSVPSARLVSPLSPIDVLERAASGTLYSPPAHATSPAIPGRSYSPLAQVKPYIAAELQAGSPTAGETLKADEGVEFHLEGLNGSERI